MSGQDRGPIVVAVAVAMISASTVFVLLRLISRITIVKRVGLDDYLIIAAWCTSFGLSFSIAYAVKYELGRHQDTIPLPDLEVLQRLEYAFSVLYNPTLILTKTSICVFFLSLSEVRPVFRYSVISTMVVIIAAGVALSLLNIFQCSPMSALFQIPRPESAQCIDIITLYLSSAPVNIITDLVLMLLPMPILKSMWIPRKQKIILYILFGFGIFITAVDIVRISYLQSATQYRLEQATLSKNAGDSQQATDFSWYASYSFLWTAIEVNVGIMVASAIHLKPLVTRFMPKMLRDDGEMTPQKRRSVARTLNSSEMAACHRVPSATIHNFPGSATPFDPDHEGEPERVEEEAEMGFVDFITTPDMRDMPTAERTQTALTNDTALTRRGTAFLNFVDMTEQKSIVYMTNRESFRPVALVTCLFFIWGFAYGLLNSLNGEFQMIARWSTSQTIALHGLYYAGYFFGPLTIGRWILKNWGFKATYIIGLMIYGTGTLIFWPAAVLTSFSAFLISNFIVGIGLSTLEIGANPFMALCGPARYAEARLNLSQGVQAVGTVISPILAKKALFHSVQNSPSLVDTQWTYLAISLLTFILAFIYYIIDLPEVTDAELEAAARVTHPNGTLELLRQKRTLWITLALGVTAQFLYVASQEAVSTSIPACLALLMPTQDVVNFEAIGHALFAVSRFLAGFLAFFIKPRYLLLACLLGTVLFSALAMTLNTGGTAAASMILLVYFFEGPLFSLIFVAPLRGLGRDTKDAAALMTAAISGGAILEPIQWAVANARNYQYSYCVIIAFFAAATVFPLYLNFYPLARMQVDPRKGAAGDLSAGPDLPPFQTVEQVQTDQASSRSPSKELRERGRGFLAFAGRRRKMGGNEEVDVVSDDGS